jgi:hypothetical protein
MDIVLRQLLKGKNRRRWFGLVRTAGYLGLLLSSTTFGAEGDVAPLPQPRTLDPVQQEATKAQKSQTGIIDHVYSSRIADRIVGGKECSDAPAVGGILYQGQMHCTGTLVDDLHVVTAAHCVYGFSPQNMTFVIGNDALLGNRQLIPVSEGVYHPKYDPRPGHFGVNDVALITLEHRPSNVLPIPIRSSPLPGSFRNTLHFIGYGYSNGITHDGLGKKRCVDLAVAAVSNTRIAYNTPGLNTCNGDSGGPAMSKNGSGWELAAITSFGDDQCVVDGYSMRADAYRQWFKGEIDKPSNRLVADDVGCSDGQREGFTDKAQFPSIAGCGANWQRESLRAVPTGRSCGNQKGLCLVPADACAVHWHVCGAQNSGKDIAAKVTAAQCKAQDGSYVAALGDQECESCDPDSGYGAVCCGSECINQNGSCVWPHETPWKGIIDGQLNRCGDIEQTYPAGNRGVLCCKDGPAAVAGTTAPP